MQLTYGQLKRQHPEYDAEEWRNHAALYAGGRRLLKDPEAMAALFPRHVGEEPEVYNERKKRAFVIPYAGQIVDIIVAAVFSDDFTVEKDEEPLDENDFWHEFTKDCSPPGGDEKSLRQVAREQLRTALIKGRAWALVELPPRAEIPPVNRLEQEKSGQLDPWVCLVEPENVTNWKTERNGELRWAMVRYLDDSQHEIDEAAGTIRAEYTLYSATSWIRWTFSYRKDKEPRDDAPMDQATFPDLDVTSGPLSFGRVPLVRLELPEGLYAMGKLASLATEHFNKSNAKAWGEYRGLFQFLAFTLKDDIASPNADPDRAVNQAIGPGRAWVGAEGDKVEVIAANPEPFKVAAESLKDLRDEMFRVVHQMSQSVDANKDGALRRSGESKKQDKAGEALVYLAFGELVIKLLDAILAMAAAGRGETDAELRARGLDTYDDISVQGLVEQEAIVETIPIRSQTFQVERQFEFARRYLGKSATDEKLKAIREELEANISAEEFEPVVMPPPGAPAGGEDDDEEQPKGKPVVSAPAPQGKRVAYSSKG